MDRSFIELTADDGKRIWVNVDHIVNFYDEGDYLTRINLDDGYNPVFVREAALHILNLINGVNGDPNGETL